METLSAAGCRINRLIADYGASLRHVVFVCYPIGTTREKQAQTGIYCTQGHPYTIQKLVNRSLLINIVGIEDKLWKMSVSKAEQGRRSGYLRTFLDILTSLFSWAKADHGVNLSFFVLVNFPVPISRSNEMKRIRRKRLIKFLEMVDLYTAQLKNLYFLSVLQWIFSDVSDSD